MSTLVNTGEMWGYIWARIRRKGALAGLGVVRMAYSVHVQCIQLGDLALIRGGLEIAPPTYPIIAQLSRCGRRHYDLNYRSFASKP